MGDPLREKWKKQSVVNYNEETNINDHATDTKKTKRQHKDFIVNLTEESILINGLGSEGFIILEVAGKDAYGKAFFNISNIPDKVLDSNIQYYNLIEKEYIQEITIEEYKVLVKKIELYRKKNAAKNEERIKKIQAYKSQKEKSRWEGEEETAGPEYDSFDVDSRSSNFYDPDDIRNYI